MDMKASQLTEEQIIGILREHEPGCMRFFLSFAHTLLEIRFHYIKEVAKAVRDIHFGKKEPRVVQGC
jgi:deferrochelatase/peroxidase EfeB